MAEKFKEQIKGLKEKGINPKLAIVRVGEREDDVAYEKGALKRFAGVEALADVVALPADISQEEFDKVIVRLNDDKRKDFNVGDTILFYKEPEKIENIQAIILKKDIFNNFDEMADKLSKTELGFANMTKEEMIKVYRTIYSKENENKYGVVAFKIKVF